MYLLTIGILHFPHPETARLKRRGRGQSKRAILGLCGFAQLDEKDVTAPDTVRQRTGLRSRTVPDLDVSQCSGSVFSLLPFLSREMSPVASPCCILLLSVE